MPQIFQVLCCYNCEMFQVQQVKKSNKWQCRVCNEKQSLKKAFKIGSSRDCRFLVQELNLKKSGTVHNNDESSAYEDDACNTLRDENQMPNSDAFDETRLYETYERNFVPDEIWLKADGIIEDEENRCILDFAPETCKRSFPEENVNDFAEKHLETAETIQFKSQERTPELFNITKQCKSDNKHINLEESQIHTKEANMKTASLIDSYPPLKKNRGFKMILNAASKLK